MLQGSTRVIFRAAAGAIAGSLVVLSVAWACTPGGPPVKNDGNPNTIVPPERLFVPDQTSSVVPDQNWVIARSPCEGYRQLRWAQSGVPTAEQPIHKIRFYCGIPATMQCGSTLAWLGGEDAGGDFQLVADFWHPCLVERTASARLTYGTPVLWDINVIITLTFPGHRWQGTSSFCTQILTPQVIRCRDSAVQASAGGAIVYYQ